MHLGPDTVGYNAEMPWRTLITADPAVCHGKPCFAGTRVLVSAVLDNLAAGLSAEQVVAQYPSLTPPHVAAALGYAAELTRERTVDLSPQKVA